MKKAIEFVKEHGGIREFRLVSNGLRVLLAPSIIGEALTLMVHYNVGSRNEGAGHTGSAHFLEHLLFKGSKRFPKNTYPFMKMTGSTGAQVNAGTWLDWTIYHETTTSEHLGLFMEMEADRMRNALFTDKDRQDEMTVVRSELEMRENSPSNMLETSVVATAIREHPYHHPTIGWRSDVEGVDTARFRAFYDTFYYPNNAMVVLIGSIAEERALDMIVSHFGHVEASVDPIPGVHTVEPEQRGERRVIVKRPGGTGIVQLAWMAPGVSHQDFAALEVLAFALSYGRRSLLNQKFVNSGRVRSIFLSHFDFKDPYPLILDICLMRQTGHKTVEREVRSYLVALQENGIGEEHIIRAKRFARAKTWYGRDSLEGVMLRLAMAEGAGSWEYYFTIPEKMQKVSREDVARVFQKYFHSDNLTVGWFVPEKVSYCKNEGAV